MSNVVNIKKSYLVFDVWSIILKKILITNISFDVESREKQDDTNHFVA